MSDPAVFDRPELAALWSEVRRRLEAAGDGEVRTIRLAGLDPPQRAALADLLGWARLPGTQATVALAQVEQALRRGCGLGVRELLVRLHGPLRDRPAERARRSRRGAPSCGRSWRATHWCWRFPRCAAGWTRCVAAG